MQISSASYYADLSKSYLTQSATAQNNTQTNTSPLDKSTSIQQQQEIQALKSRDQEVRNHEQAHLNAAGGLAVSGAHFSYTTGPDGQRYAVGGDVSIDIAEVADDPQATLNKADIIRRAAMAPAQPSAQDFSVASKAAAMANKARTELLLQTSNQPSASELDIKA